MPRIPFLRPVSGENGRGVQFGNFIPHVNFYALPWPSSADSCTEKCQPGASSTHGQAPHTQRHFSQGWCPLRGLSETLWSCTILGLPALFHRPQGCVVGPSRVSACENSCKRLCHRGRTSWYVTPAISAGRSGGRKRNQAMQRHKTSRHPGLKQGGLQKPPPAQLSQSGTYFPFR